jgi:hypothetical protein
VLRRRTVLLLEPLEERIVCSAGDLDLTFNGTGKQFLLFPDGGGANAVAVQSDGKVVMVGSSGLPPLYEQLYPPSGPGFDVARLDPKQA